MYETLTTEELNMLQEVLYEGVQAAFRVASGGLYDPDLFQHHVPVHSEVGHLFLEAGEELIHRLAPPQHSHMRYGIMNEAEAAPRISVRPRNCTVVEPRHLTLSRIGLCQGIRQAARS